MKRLLTVRNAAVAVTIALLVLAWSSLRSAETQARRRLEMQS